MVWPVKEKGGLFMCKSIYFHSILIHEYGLESCDGCRLSGLMFV